MAAASSVLHSTSPRLPFSPTRKPLTPKPLRLRLHHTLASSSPPPPPPADGAEADPIKLAFARAAAYKQERDSPPPPPPVKQSESGEEAFARALEYRSGNGGARGGGSAVLFGVSSASGASNKEEYEYNELDFLGLNFSEKKRYRGPPPGLAPVADPFPDEDFPEVEIIIGDPSKFEKTPRSREIEPVKEDSESEKTSHSIVDEPDEDKKLEKMPRSTAVEPDDVNSELYKPKVTSWGMFPRPQNISKAYGGGRSIRLGGETQSAEEKASKDKRTRELIAAFRNRHNITTIDEKTKDECKKALEGGDELMNAGRLRQALPYYEKVMQSVDFQTELHGMAALQWSICLDSLCRSKEAMSMYSKLRYHPNVEISKKANMFMFSFQAMDFMKVNSSPVPRSTGYETYFNKFVDQKNYYTSLEEPAVGIDQIFPYLIFLVSPIFLVAFVALRKSFQL